MIGLPGARCPFCDSARCPIEWARDAVTGGRTWKCPACGRTWSQDGAGGQGALDLGAVEVMALDLN